MKAEKILAGESLAKRCTEQEFQDALVDAAKLLGWIVYHTYDSRRSAAGFPDLTLVKKGRLLFLELKSERGRPSVEQVEWLRELGNCSSYWESSPVLGAFLVYPSHWEKIVELLRSVK